MLTRKLNIKLLFAFTVAFAGILTGCTAPLSTRPNEPYKGSLPGFFHILAQKNLLLATELAKLPEIHDGISDSEKIALEKMGQLYMSGPDSFDAAFKKMYRIGKPGVRKYCSPLQALFWMAEDGNLTVQNNPLVNYSLKTILITAHCLNKAGYKAWPEEPEDKNHITTFFKSEGGIYILDNAWRFHHFTGLSGPYSDRQSALNAFE